MPAALLLVHGPTMTFRSWTWIRGHESRKGSTLPGSEERVTVLALASTEEHSQGCVGIPRYKVPGVERFWQLPPRTTAQSFGTEILAPW
jgi:hypothetical protein